MNNKNERYVIQTAEADADRYDKDLSSKAWQNSFEGANVKDLLEQLLTAMNDDDCFTVDTWFRLVDTKTNKVTNF
jgi:hypothetical protein